jgi:hypothetical protein
LDLLPRGSVRYVSLREDLAFATSEDGDWGETYDVVTMPGGGGVFTITLIDSGEVFVSTAKLSWPRLTREMTVTDSAGDVFENPTHTVRVQVAPVPVRVPSSGTVGAVSSSNTSFIVAINKC